MARGAGRSGNPVHPFETHERADLGAGKRLPGARGFAGSLSSRRGLPAEHGADLLRDREWFVPGYGPFTHDPSGRARSDCISAGETPILNLPTETVRNVGARLRRLNFA
jgi:hypothetical protein